MLEFFNKPGLLHPEMVKNNGEYEDYNSFASDQAVQRMLLLLLDNDKSRAVVVKMKQNGISEPRQIVCTFKHCNFDALDSIPDVNDDNTLNFEYVDCGHKGANRQCPYSMCGDNKPYCIIKTRYLIPVSYGK